MAGYLIASVVTQIKQSRDRFKGVDWVASHPLFGGAQNKTIENNCEYYGGNKSKTPYSYPIVILLCDIASISCIRVFNQVPILKLPHFWDMAH